MLPEEVLIQTVLSSLETISILLKESSLISKVADLPSMITRLNGSLDEVILKLKSSKICEGSINLDPTILTLRTQIKTDASDVLTTLLELVTAVYLLQRTFLEQG